MDLKDIASRATERIKSVFSKNNAFFYGNQGYQPQAEEGQAYAPGGYGQQDPMPQQPGYGPAGWQQHTQAYQAPQMGAYQQAAAQGRPQQPGPQAQSPYMQQQNPYVHQQQQAWQAPVQPQQPAYETQFSSGSFGQGMAPQQAQQQQDQDRRNRRSAQHEQVADNLVQFPGQSQEAEAAQQMDAYVVNVSSVSGCRQAMTCLRKGQCTLVVMDQLIDKAEVRRYVDMLNGACFALGGTMTRLSLKVGFYLLAPSEMTVYTDPVTASANAPRTQAMPQQAGPAQAYQAQPQQTAYPQQQGPYAQQAPYQAAQGQLAQQMPYQAQPGPAPGNPYAPPMQHQGGYAQPGYQDERYAQ